uniref:Adrenomedullin 2 n=1 Tax=Oryzias latipes TaxID=8090 RepID=A0A3P9LP19_ORYLA
MCASSPAWLCALLLLLSLQLQALGAQRHSLSSSRIYNFPKPSHPSVLPTESDLSLSVNNRILQEGSQILWRAPPDKEALLHRNQNVFSESKMWQRGLRRRRHANGSNGRGHMMRVGCVLGTCQVQNLSHRLYQLIGQSGKEDSSPINPRSPHSYG